MQRILLLFLSLFSFSNLAYSQAPPFNWARGAGTNSDQQALGIVTDPSGNVYTCGYLRNANNNFSGNLISAFGGEDIFIAKYDQNGTYIWAKNQGGVSNDHANSITTDASGNTYITGFYIGTATFYGSVNIVLTSTGSSDIFIAKFDPAGNVLWAKSAGSASGNDEGTSICTDGTNVYVTGFFNGTANFPGVPTLTSAGGSDVFVASFNANTGATNFAVRGGSAFNDIGNGIAVDATGIYVGGTYGDGNISFQNHTGSLANLGFDDIFLVKYDLTGASGLWKLRMGANPGLDGGNSVCVNGTNVYVAGFFNGNLSAYQGNSGSVGGTIASVGGDDAFVAQYNASNGAFNWIRSTAGSVADRANSVATNPVGDVFITGKFTGTINLSPDPNITSTLDDPFIIKYNTAGTRQWGKQIGGTNNDVGSGIVAPTNNEIYTCGWIKSAPATFDAINVNSVGGDDIYFAKLGCNVTASLPGPPQTVCSVTATMAANNPTVGTGLWSLVSGTGVITTPSSPNSGVTGLGVGANVFRWTINNAGCISSDDVTITRDASPTSSNAGPNQIVCTTTATLAGNNPTSGTGLWTLVSGSGTITTPSSPTSGLTGLGPGANVFRWTISNGVCTPSFSDVTITRDNTSPVFTVCPSTQTAISSPTCTFTLPNYIPLVTATDACAITYTQNPVAGTVVGVGTMPIQITATDLAGNSSICTFSLIVSASVNPKIAVCGSNFIGETTFGFGNNGNNFSCISPSLTPGQDRYYQITVPAANYLIRVTMGNMVDANDAFADVLWVGAGCPGSTCLSATRFFKATQKFSNGTNQMTYAAPGPGTYFLVIDSRTDGITNYNIKFDCIISGIEFDNTACVGDIDNDGIIPKINGSNAILSVKPCQHVIVCHDIFVKNVNNWEWLDSVNMSLGSCYTNVTNISPNGVSNGFYQSWELGIIL